MNSVAMVMFTPDLEVLVLFRDESPPPSPHPPNYLSCFSLAQVVCREINHGQSLLMSLWLPESGRDFVLRLAEEKSFVLLSAGIVLVRNLSQVVWCVDKRKQKKKKVNVCCPVNVLLCIPTCTGPSCTGCSAYNDVT